MFENEYSRGYMAGYGAGSSPFSRLIKIKDEVIKTQAEVIDAKNTKIGELEGTIAVLQQNIDDLEARLTPDDTIRPGDKVKHIRFGGSYEVSGVRDTGHGPHFQLKGYEHHGFCYTTEWYEKI